MQRLLVTNDDGRRFNVIILEPGEKTPGSGREITPPPINVSGTDQRTVVIFDDTYSDSPNFTRGYGQRVTSYYATTMLGEGDHEQPIGFGGRGLDMFGAPWILSAANCHEILGALRVLEGN